MIVKYQNKRYNFDLLVKTYEKVSSPKLGIKITYNDGTYVVIEKNEKTIHWILSQLDSNLQFVDLDINALELT